MRKPYVYIISLTYIAILLSGCTSLTGSYRDYTTITGTIVEGRYISPQKDFSIKVPPLLHPGAVIRDRINSRGGMILFTDDVGTLVLVDFTNMNEGEKQILKQIGLLDFMKQYRDSKVEMFKQAVPRSKLIHQEFIELDGKSFDFYMCDFPEGATLTDAIKNKRGDAKRGNLTFIKANSIFMLSTQQIQSDTFLQVPGGRSEFFGVSTQHFSYQNEDIAVIANKMKERLISIYHNMTFASE